MAGRLGRVTTGALLLAGLALSIAHAQDLPSRLDGYLRDRSGTPFNGVVLVARGDSVLLEHGYGLADADLGVPNDITLRFGIGSLTKPFTATAVMRLAERGRLRLDDSVCRYLAQCPPAWQGVTLRHLLGHTSGVPDLFGELPAAPVDSTRALIDAAISRHLGDTLLARPGARYAYSNFNYFLLGYALEVAGHAPWETVLREEVFGPAGLKDTEYDDVWTILPNRVRGYEQRDGHLRNIRYHDHASYAAGGLLSTARDLFRFDRALSTGKIISDSALRLMSTPGLGNYGLGWQIIRVFGHTLRNHTGGTNGFSSHLAHYDDGLTIVVLSNIEDAPVKATACDLAAIVFGLQPSPRTAGGNSCRAEP